MSQTAPSWSAPNVRSDPRLDSPPAAPVDPPTGRKPVWAERWTQWWPMALPIAAGLGALVAAPVALWVAGLPVALAVWWTVAQHRGLGRLAVVGAVAVVCTSLAASAWDGLAAPLPGRLEDRVQLVKDPRPVVRGVRVEVRHQGVRYDAVARGAPAGVLANLRAGETVELSGPVTRRDPSDRWRASRHVAGLVEVEQASRPGSAGGLWGLANVVHRAMGHGARDLAAAQRGVLLGVSVGDRSAIPAVVADDLRAAGLSHLTAVSGQHVALLLAMVAPVMRRIAVRPRAVAVAAVLVGFVVLTRGEPSVLRAVGMALAVEAARSGGQRVRGLRVLGLTVTVLLVIDPLLVWSVAFQLSVAATAGIAVGATRLAARIPGPRYLGNLVAMGVCAQIAVAPLAANYFGQVSITGVVANVLVSPVVGVVMGWGLTAGVVTGLTGIGSGVVHLPTTVLGGWMVSVAGWFAGLPVGQARPLHVAVVIAAVAVLMIASRRGWVIAHRLSVAVVLVTLVTAAVMPPGPAVGRHTVATGAEVVVGGQQSVLVLDGRAEVGAVLSSLRGLGVVRVGVVISRTGSAGSLGVAAHVCDRLGPCDVLAPGDGRSGAQSDGSRGDEGIEFVTEPRSWAVGPDHMVTVAADGDRLDVDLVGPAVGPPPESADQQFAGVGAR